MYAWVRSEIVPRDPVCGVVLNEKTAKFNIKHEGETYYFCSVKCKKRFKRNRRKFTK
jgi:Cu+-exporting ATPase